MYIALLLIFFTYHFTVFYVFAIGTYGVTFSDISTLIFLIIIAKKTIWEGKKFNFVLNPGFIFLLVLVTASLISGISPLLSGSGDQITQYIKTLSHFLFLVSFTLIASLYPIDSSIWTKIIKMWLIMSIFINLFGIYQIPARALDLPFAWIDITNPSFTARGTFDDEVATKQLSLRFGGFFRATSIYSEPSALAGFNLFIIIFTAIPFLQGKKPFLKSKGLTIFIFTLSLISLLMAYSLTGLLGTALILGLGAVIHFSKRILHSLPIVAVVLVFLIYVDTTVYNHAGTSIIKLFEVRIEGIVGKSTFNEGMSGESFFTRTETIKETYFVWERNPIIGIGIGQLQYDKQSNLVFSDNGITTVMAEMGIPGFIGFVGFFIALFIATYKMLNKVNPSLSAEENRINSLLFYIMLILFLHNYISGNWLIWPFLWNFAAMIMASLNYTFLKEGRQAYEVKLLKHPIKASLIEYLNSKNLQKH